MWSELSERPFKQPRCKAWSKAAETDALLHTDVSAWPASPCSCITKGCFISFYQLFFFCSVYSSLVCCCNLDLAVKSSEGWAATQAGFFWLKINRFCFRLEKQKLFLSQNYSLSDTITLQRCKSMLCLSVSRPLSWITTLQSATLSRTPRTHSSTWSSRCSWAKYLVSVSLCANLYHSCFDHNSPIEPGPCFNVISWPQLHCYISV